MMNFFYLINSLMKILSTIDKIKWWQFIKRKNIKRYVNDTLDEINKLNIFKYSSNLYSILSSMDGRKVIIEECLKYNISISNNSLTCIFKSEKDNNIIRIEYIPITNKFSIYDNKNGSFEIFDTYKEYGAKYKKLWKYYEPLIRFKYFSALCLIAEYLLYGGIMDGRTDRKIKHIRRTNNIKEAQDRFDKLDKEMYSSS